MYQYKNILKRGVFIDIKNIIFSVIESLIGKLTPVLFIFLSLLIFLPEAFIVKWGLKEFYNDNKLIIGLLYLYSISYLIVLFLKFAYKGIQKQYKKIEKRKSERKQLEEILSNNQKKILKKIYYSENQTYEFSIQDSSVVMLEKMLIITRTNISVRGTLFNYSLQPWVKEYLDSNADDYFKDLK